MSKAYKNKQAAEELGTGVRDSFESTLTLKPAELEALIARLCACGTRRVKSIARTRVARACGAGECGQQHRVRAEWCRLGDRGRTIRLVDTKFG